MILRAHPWDRRRVPHDDELVIVHTTEVEGLTVILGRVRYGSDPTEHFPEWEPQWFVCTTFPDGSFCAGVLTTTNTDAAMRSYRNLVATWLDRELYPSPRDYLKAWRDRVREASTDAPEAAE